MTNGTTTGLPPTLEEVAPALRRRVASRRRRAVVAGVFVLAGVAAAAVVASAPRGIRAITQGKVYQSGALPATDLREGVRRHAIRTVIDVREASEEVRSESTVLAALGVRHIHIPTSEVAGVPDDAGMRRFLEVMSDPATYPVLIHCHHGIGRSVLYRIRRLGPRARAAGRPPSHPPDLSRRHVRGGRTKGRLPPHLHAAPRRARQRAGGDASGSGTMTSIDFGRHASWGGIPAPAEA
jgi:protein tyrosine phosphatase (PTP) superfamily phosphohydrolase (DUF442 family)